ncbi:arylsulfatase [Joostella atrarenae]|uniref:Arylsulfatase n=1 Tax=Joostella atrarenae TaxID=679257 RepID=A0ABS9J2W3_9FLAO|nr:arylsulfatase [Joostella atrarenae]MCF8714690.1 arylsulfatase [Joostella atrarenae]
MNSNKLFVLSIIYLVILLFSCNSKTTKKEKAFVNKQPNILFILADDQGYGDFSAYGNTILKTPNIDKIYKESTRFNNFFVSPVCSPTRASIMTGRYNQRTGVWDTWKGRVSMHGDEYTIAEALKDRGYTTALFGKWHLGYNTPQRPMDQGFDKTFEFEEYAKDSATRFDPIMKSNGVLDHRKGFLTDVVFDDAIEWIEEKSKENKPFFAYVATYMPHTADKPQVPFEYVKPFLKNDSLVRHTAEVYGMISKLDENVGRLMTKINELNLDENTLIIYMSDNGPQIEGGDQGRQVRYNIGMRGEKGNVYDGGIKVPCFFRWQGKLRAGHEIKSMAAHIDLLPSLVEIADNTNLNLPNPIDGISLVPALFGKNHIPKSRTFFSQWDRAAVPKLWNNVTMRTDTFKLVNGKELYDISKDPYESNNIAEDKPEVFNKMIEATKKWFDDVSSTRGYVTSYTELGSSAQKKLTLQFFDRNENGWPLKVLKTGPYKFIVENVQPDLFPHGAKLCIKIGDTLMEKDMVKGKNEIVFENIEVGTGLQNLTVYTKGFKTPKIGRWNQEDLGYRNIIIEYQE